MLYLLTGKGTMPPKEATTVLGQLLEQAEAQAQESGEEELEFWLAVDSDHTDPEQRFWAAVAQWAADNGIYVADTGDALALLGSEDGAALLAVPVDPGFAAPEDERLADLVASATLLGATAWCFNGQMYEVEVEVEERPDDDGDTVALTEQGTADATAGMSMAELKQFAKDQGAEPENWRSRKAIVAALHAVHTGSAPREAPDELEVIEVSNTVEPVEDDAAEYERWSADLEECVRHVVREELTSALLDALSRLGRDG